MTADGPDSATPPGGERALREFLSEAQEIVDGLSRDLLALDAQRRGGGGEDPDLINGCFRGVHSLKGLSGLFGLRPMTELSHALESLLDAIRLGRVEPKPAVLDLLFEAVELYGRMFATIAEGRELDAAQVAGYLARLGAAGRGGPEPAGLADDALGGYRFEPAMLSVLTEYEEHRLRENIKAGRAVLRLRAAFDLLTIDSGLEQLKQQVKPLGEVITYLPSAQASDESKLELDVLVGTTAGAAALRAALEGTDVEVHEIPRGGPAPPPVPPRRGRAEPAGPLAGDARALARAARDTDFAARPPPPAPEPAAEPREAGDDEEVGSLRSVSQTVRVDIRKLDTLMNVVGELAVSHADISAVLRRLAERHELTDEVRALTRAVRVLERKLGEMQQGILEVRMVPLRQVFDKLARVVRKISRDAGKDIRLDIAGADTELDKLIVEELSDPLMHIIRNAIDHGIELPAERRAARKPDIGTIRVEGRQQGNRVVVTVADDGAGIDVQKVAAAAVRRGLVDAAAVRDMSKRELCNLLFLPGMSTREEPTELSGRGVGLDVVKTNMARLSGIIDIESTRGQGTEIVITLPITLAILQALVVRAAARTYAVPLNSVLESLILDAGEVRTIERREVCTLRNQTLPLARLDDLFQLARPPGEARPAKPCVVVVGVAQHRLGLVVDELVGQQDVVIKSLGRLLSRVRGVAGATELGHHQTVLVLDVPALVEEALGRGAAEAA